MDYLEWSSNILSSVSWPIAAVVIGYGFRTQIAALIGRIEGASWGDAKVNFGKRLDKMEEGARELADDKKYQAPVVDGKPHAVNDDDDERKFEKLLSISPNAAIIHAWGHVDHLLLELAKGVGIKYIPPSEQLEKRLSEFGIINKDAFNVVREMRRMKNAAAHNRIMTPTDALRFRGLTEVMEDAIRREASPKEDP